MHSTLLPTTVVLLERINEYLIYYNYNDDKYITNHEMNTYLGWSR